MSTDQSQAINKTKDNFVAIEQPALSNVFFNDLLNNKWAEIVVKERKMYQVTIQLWI